MRETFNRDAHLAQNGNTATAQQAQRVEPPLIFDEPAIRATLAQQGLDFSFQIFPIGESPADATGRAANREARIAELENEQPKFRKRATDAEAIAAAAAREVTALKARLEVLQVANDTLTKELESLRPKTQEAA